MRKLITLICCSVLLSMISFAQEVVKGGDMEDPSAWNFYYNEADAKDVSGTIQFNYTADKPSAGSGGCYRISTYGQSATFLWQKIHLLPGHKYRFNGAFKNASPATTKNVWLEFGIMKEQPKGGEIATGEFTYVFNLNTWMGADTLNVDTTFEEYFPFSGAPSNVFTIPLSETDMEWFIVIKTGCWNDLGNPDPTYDFLFDNISVYDLTTNVVTGSDMEDASAWNFYYNETDAKDVNGTIEFGYKTDTPASGIGGCYRVSTYGQSATFLWQPITITPGHSYTFSGAFKNASPSTTANVWLEYGIMRNQPKGGEISTGEFSYVYNLNTWMGADTLNVDTTFEEYFLLAGSETTPVITIPDTVTDTEWFIVIKTGCWNELGNPNPTYDFLFDNIALYDVSISNTGGDMEDPSAWNFYQNPEVPDQVAVHTFGYTTDTPSEGIGGCYRVSSYGQSATFLWQPVTINPGHRYSLTGAFKNASPATTTNVWIELILTRWQPSGGEVQPSAGDFRYGMNTWQGAEVLNIDGTFQNNFPIDAGGPDNPFLIPDTVTSLQWYIVIKAGCWNEVGNPVPTFDVLFDEIYLADLGPEPWITLPIANVVVGSVDNDADFSANVRMKYDADSIYMIFNTIDDVIVNTGTSYQVDNIEVYFDMDNSKNIHYPRNGGWLKSIDDAYDTNDFQLRLVPGVAFATNNSARPASASIASGYNQVYSQTANGYQFILNIAWDVLMPGFVAEGGKLIGFDVLWSDNDVSASDANRNQITWNSPTDKPFNDPSLFGVLQLTPSGSFIVIEDTEKPTNPTNLVAVADGSSINLTWDASTDNRVVHQYIIYDKATVIDTIYAKQSGNTYKISNLENGTHRPGVVAMDVYGNKSSKMQTDNITIAVSAHVLAEGGYQVYPNPTNGIVKVMSNSTMPVQLAIYTLTGEKIHAETFTGRCMLDLSDKQKGMYIINLATEGKTTISKLMIK